MLQRTQNKRGHRFPLLMRFSTLFSAFFSTILSGCAIMPPVVTGETEAAVLAKLGKPAGRYLVNQEQWLEYPTGPAGQFTYFAYIDAEGKLRAYEQVLSNAKFATIEVDKATKEDVLRTIGHPGNTSSLRNPNFEVWSYRYKESGVWNSVMHVHFDPTGIVRKMLNVPESEREPGEGFRP